MKSGSETDAAKFGTTLNFTVAEPRRESRKAERGKSVRKSFIKGFEFVAVHFIPPNSKTVIYILFYHNDGEK